MGQIAHAQQPQQHLSLQHQQQLRLQQQQQAQQQAQQVAREQAMKAHLMHQQASAPGRGAAPGAAAAAAAAAAQRGLPGSTAGMTSGQAALANADAAAAKAKNSRIVAGPPGSTIRPPGIHPAILQHPALGLQQLQQQQQQQQQQLAEAAKKRKRADSYLLPPPPEALSMESVFARIRMANDGMLPPAAGSAAAAAAAAGESTEGPSLSVEYILNKPEYQRAAAAAAAAGKAGAGGAAGLKGGRGRDGRRDDEGHVLPESQLRRLMELQGLNKVRHSTCECAGNSRCSAEMSMQSTCPAIFFIMQI
jgi:hypothetical protein